MRGGTRELAGKVALVVDGGREPGAAYAEALAALGATTVISYVGDGEGAARTLDRLDRHRVTIEAIHSDPTSAVEMDRLFHGVVRRFGRIDVVVHAAPSAADCPAPELRVRSVRNALRGSARYLATSGTHVGLTERGAFSVCQPAVVRALGQEPPVATR